MDCERAFLAELDGNCKTPIAGQAWIVDGKVRRRPDGALEGAHTRLNT